MPDLKLPVFRRGRAKRKANECDVLRWAAGAAIDLSEVGAVDEAKLLDLVIRHRLAARFLDRAQRERPA